MITRENRTSGCKAPEIRPRVYLRYRYLQYIGAAEFMKSKAPCFIMRHFLALDAAVLKRPSCQICLPSLFISNSSLDPSRSAASGSAYLLFRIEPCLFALRGRAKDLCNLEEQMLVSSQTYESTFLHHQVAMADREATDTDASSRD